MSELAAPAGGAMANLRQMRGLKDVPLLRQLAAFAGVALAVALGLTLFNWSQKPEYVALYPGLSDKDSAELADALRTAGIEYKLDAAGGGVTVAPDQVHAARLRAAAQGLPKGGGSGFEMIQQDQGFGTSQFIENARYQLALETELARTVASLQPVKSARVHLAVPKPSAFAGSGKNAPSASVVVDLQPGRSLEANQVDSIQHIVASSVPGMNPKSVTVIDQFGRLLGSDKQNDEFAESTEQYQFARRAEADYVRRIESLIAPMVGAGRLSAQVAADFDFSVTEEAHESFDPQRSVVRSEQVNETQRRDGSSAEASGIPGATSNQPPAAPRPEVAAAADPKTDPNAANKASAETDAAMPPSQSTKSETRNYEVDRTLSHTRQAQGRLKRLSVALLVDNPQRVGADGKVVSAPMTFEEITKIENLVKQAIGFNAARGDSVTVQNAPFVASIVEPQPDPPIWQRGDVRGYARQGLGALVVLGLIMFVLRPLLRNLVSGAPRSAAESAAPTASSSAGGALVDERLPADSLSLSAHAMPEPAALAASQATAAFDHRLTTARAAVTQDPKRVAQVMKTWLNEDG